MGLTTTSRGDTCRLGENPNICALPSICGDDGDGSETETEGPKFTTTTSNGVMSNLNTSTSSGCARAYESEKDGEGGTVCKYIDSTDVNFHVDELRTKATLSTNFETFHFHWMPNRVAYHK